MTTALPSSWPTRLPLVAILRGVQPDEVLAHGQALLNAGFDALEVPTNSPDWALSVGLLHQHLGQRAWVGAGTVWQTSQLDAMVSAGARLMVMPHTDAALIAEGVRRGLHVVAGFATASEAFAALRAGAQALKLFPAGAAGLQTMQALRAVLPPQVPVLAVGGVTPANLHTCLAAGCHGAGLGSDLYKPGQSVTTTTERAQAFVQAWRALQSR